MNLAVNRPSSNAHGASQYIAERRNLMIYFMVASTEKAERRGIPVRHESASHLVYG
jgi:hypothetical protein